MLVKQLSELAETRAADYTELREILHPHRDDVSLRYSLAHAVVGAGAASLRHSLKTSEVYYILSGSGIMHVGNDVRTVGPGDAVYIPPDTIQWLENPGDEPVEFLCVVDPAWREEDETVVENAEQACAEDEEARDLG